MTLRQDQYAGMAMAMQQHVEHMAEPAEFGHEAHDTRPATLFEAAQNICDAMNDAEACGYPVAFYEPNRDYTIARLTVGGTGVTSVRIKRVTRTYGERVEHKWEVCQDA